MSRGPTIIIDHGKIFSILVGLLKSNIDAAGVKGRVSCHERIVFACGFSLFVGASSQGNVCLGSLSAIAGKYPESDVQECRAF
jgi:hypothetical protein